MIATPDGRGGYFWRPTDENTGLDGSERPRHQAPRAPRASTTQMLRAVSQASYAPQAPVHWHTINQAGARVLCTPGDRAPGCDAPSLAQAEAGLLAAAQRADSIPAVPPEIAQAGARIARERRQPDPGECLRRLADSVRLQDDGSTSGP